MPEMPGDVADARHTVAARVAAQRAHARDGSDAGDARDDAVGCWGCLRCTRWRARGRRASAARAANRLRRRPQRRALFLLVLFPSFPSSFLPFFRSFFLFLAASCFRYRPITARVETRHSGRSTVSFVHWFFLTPKNVHLVALNPRAGRDFGFVTGFLPSFSRRFRVPCTPESRVKTAPGFLWVSRCYWVFLYRVSSAALSCSLHIPKSCLDSVSSDYVTEFFFTEFLVCPHPLVR